jgi:hypothetical protein
MVAELRMIWEGQSDSQGVNSGSLKWLVALLISGNVPTGRYFEANVRK